ncbi:Metal tolerance protein 4 [Porphyridium purpureum]|uniref:Metal tolerance protein 4 n=1 Tax=Porphyridium purpureum TaxID=35688 RepID=A0A5J4YY13_PORPP|nr:Metal tolerance protein 4 [Porphyridium purpureum]|eukprot:POR3544..scf209_3
MPRCGDTMVGHTGHDESAERRPLLTPTSGAGVDDDAFARLHVNVAVQEPGGGSWEESVVQKNMQAHAGSRNRNTLGFVSVRDMWQSAYMDEEQLNELVESKSLKSATRAGLREFYEAQNELLEAFVRHSRKNSRFLEQNEKAFLQSASSDRQKSVDDGDCESENEARERTVNRAVLVSNICNFILLFTQAFAFITSHSLSLMANLIDAVLDLTAGAVIFYTVWSRKQQRDRYAYPIGRTRLESVGVILMACLMTAATLLTLEESLQTLLGGGKDVAYQGLAWPVVVLIFFALGTKSCLYLYCRNVEDDAVQSLALDHYNDIVSNVSSLGTALAAQYFFWFLDPIGGIVISFMIIRNWYQHTKEHVDSLLGRVADPKLFSLVTFLAMNHHPLVEKVDTVRCYSMGPKCFVEVDIVLSRDLPLHLAHDIGEDLQFRIEAIDDVERAFVHLDFECEHSPTFEHKIL